MRYMEKTLEKGGKMYLENMGLPYFRSVRSLLCFFPSYVSHSLRLKPFAIPSVSLIVIRVGLFKGLRGLTVN